MQNSRLPVLLEDGSSLDWSEAHYSVEVTLRRQGASIEHRLSDAAGLQALIDAGCAEWVTELRCPRTLLSRRISGSSQRQEVTWSADEIAGDVFLLPGLVAAREAKLAHALGLSGEIWPTTAEVVFPQGWWLAKGDMRSVKPLIVSLVRFVSSADLKPGAMSVEEVSDATEVYFRVKLATDLYEHRRHDRDIQIAGLIAAFGRLPRSSLRAGGEHADSQIAERLRSEFESRGIPDWDDEDDFDPALAATAWESFAIDAQGSVEDD